MATQRYTTTTTLGNQYRAVFSRKRAGLRKGVLELYQQIADSHPTFESACQEIAQRLDVPLHYVRGALKYYNIKPKTHERDQIKTPENIPLQGPESL